MFHNRLYHHFLIFALIMILIFGSMLVEPILTNSQSLAAQSEIGVQGIFLNLNDYGSGFNAYRTEETKLTSDSDQSPEATVYYVSNDGDNSAPTEGFDTGFKYLWDAIAYVGHSGGGEIWVAAGVYYPDEGGFVTDNDPKSTFYLADTIIMYGCFDTDDKKLSDRDCDRNLTVLSGDIDKNDIKDSNGVVTDPDKIRGDNAYHVVTAAAGTLNGELDGFTITAGQANGELKSDHYGGGLYCDGKGEGKECSPTLKNIIFSGNTARVGGGMCNDATMFGTSNPYLVNVTFSNNSAELQGGAMFNGGSIKGTSSPSLINVTFAGNSAGDDGGAVYNDGMEGESSPSLINVVFSGNSAGTDAGAVFNRGDNTGISRPTLTNVLFSGNSAGWYGGAMYNYGPSGTSSPDIRNSIFWNNQDSSGTGTLRANIYNEDAEVTLGYSLLQGSGGSRNWTLDPSYVNDGSNIDVDPIFRLDINPSSAPTTAGNLRLQAGSPAIDEGKNDNISGILTDLDGEPRKVDGDSDGTVTVDMGAYERQNYTYLPMVVR